MNRLFDMTENCRKIKGSTAVYTTLGASNHAIDGREKLDFYATSPVAVDYLINNSDIPLSQSIWEPCCGKGHISERLKYYGYNVYSTDLIDRGYGDEQLDFLKCAKKFDGDIVTNPPYKLAKECIEKGMELVTDGHRVVMFLKLLFLESASRRELFDKGYLKTVYVFSKRVICAKNGAFDKYTDSAIAYCWYEFVKGYNGDTTLKWL